MNKEDGRLNHRVLLPFILKFYQVDFCYLLHSTFNSAVLFGHSAFKTPKNFVGQADLRFKTSVKLKIPRYISIRQNLCHTTNSTVYINHTNICHTTNPIVYISHIKLLSHHKSHSIYQSHKTSVKPQILQYISITQKFCHTTNPKIYINHTNLPSHHKSYNIYQSHKTSVTP